ncbi:ABC transporter permease [Sulfurospirillum arcachonense]|uniref:ABC transporter permease n=1 Tax=Sulfurospirillum arcachonense TaxID=57666 RepID=UPI00046A9AA1|nr:ABC transporter permease [Sulfurospirillum arcachonense]
MQIISITNLSYMLVPLLFVSFFYYKWVEDKKEIAYATFRMLSQLLLIGYVLTYIFNSNNSFFTLFIVIVMISAASFITLRNVTCKNKKVYKHIFLSIFLGGTINLFFVVFFVLDLDSFNSPRYVIPLAGMLYANCMNAVSLVAERFEKELETQTYKKSRAIAFKAGLIPQINSFLAVGLVSLPGMMTGQILSGVDPIIAVRYQIMVMLMILGSSGIATVTYLLQKR